MMWLSVEPWSSEQIVFCASMLGHHSSNRSSQLFAQLNQQGFGFSGAEVSAACLTWMVDPHRRCVRNCNGTKKLTGKGFIRGLTGVSVPYPTLLHCH